MGRYQHVLLGGTFIGILSVLPVVNLANCCCLWVILGGALTVYLQQQNRDTPVETGEAAVAGLLAGLLGAAIHVAVMAVMFGVTGSIDSEIQSALEDHPQVPPEVREFVLQVVSGRGIVLLLAAVSVPLYAIAGAVGALLGLAIFKKKIPPSPEA
jgi:hypothetical protein